MTEARAELQAGSIIHYKLRVRGIPVRWTSEIAEWIPPHRFVDIQISGPYSLWHHEHRFTSERDGTRIDDTVRYALPFGPLGRWMHRIVVRRDLERIFAYRQEKIRELFGE